MAKLIACTCPECQTAFTMAQEDLEGVPDVACPVCGEPFDPREEEAEAERDEEADHDDEDDQ